MTPRERAWDLFVWPPNVETWVVGGALLLDLLALVVGSQHPLAQASAIGPQALNDESMILLSAEFATREQIERYCRQHGIRPQVLMEANAIGAVIEVVRRTTLSTLLPANIVLAHDDLAAIAVRAVVERSGVDPSKIDDVILGCTNQAGEDNRDVARMAVLLAGLPIEVAGQTVNRLCGSGLQAVASAAW